MFENRLWLFEARAYKSYKVPEKASKSLRRFPTKLVMLTKIILLLLIMHRTAVSMDLWPQFASILDLIHNDASIKTCMGCIIAMQPVNAEGDFINCCGFHGLKEGNPFILKLVVPPFLNSLHAVYTVFITF